MKQTIIIILLFLINTSIYSEGTNTSNKIDSLIQLSKKYYKIDYDSCLFFCKQAKDLSLKETYNKGIAWSLYLESKVAYKQQKYKQAIIKSFQSIKKGQLANDTILIAKAYSNAGLSYFKENKFDSALTCQKECLKKYLLTENKKSTAIAYNNIGSLLINLGNYKNAIINFQKSLKIFEEMDYQNGVASCFLNIGQIYDLMGNSQDTIQNNKALMYYNKALVIYKEKNDGFKIAETHNAIGIQYDQKASIYSKYAIAKDTIKGKNTLLQRDIYYKKAIENLTKGLEIFQEIEYTLGIAQITSNIGTIYTNQGKFTVALKYLYLSLNANKLANNKKEIATNKLAIATCYRKMREYKKTIKNLNDGFIFLKEVNIPTQFQNYYEEYAIVYNKIGDNTQAYNYHVRYTNIKDSLLKSDNLTTINEVQALYKNEMNQKQLQLSESHLREEKAISEKRKLQTYGMSLFAILILVLTGFILRSLQNKKRSNKALAEKNNLITSQHDHIKYQKEEIESSIVYAQKIQEAVLPDKEYTNTLLKKHFILFKPKDVVSGDFYWMTKTKDWSIIAVADCTGHGVPGAFMSMLGISFLNEIVRKLEISEAGQVLDALRESVVDALKQKGLDGEQKDGMDMSIIALNNKTNICQFAGANNSLYILRKEKYKNKTTEKLETLIDEIKPDKMPVSIYLRMDNFKTHTFEVNEGDRLFMFTDGMPDQFGGSKGKKFKYKPFKRILANAYEKTITDQGAELEMALNNWVKYTNPITNEHFEQIDDITVLGIEI